jgi:hypothetical protein
MRDRCENPNHEHFADYGGRGIQVCVRWTVSFENFLADMGERPSPDHSIDRIHNDKGYDRSNCRWATHVEQNRNQRSNKLLDIDGRRVCLAEAAEAAGLCQETVHSRLRRGLDLATALSAPLKSIARFIQIDGQQVRLKDAARSAGIRPGTLAERLRMGWPVEKALSTPVRTQRTPAPIIERERLAQSSGSLSSAKLSTGGGSPPSPRPRPARGSHIAVA